MGFENFKENLSKYEDAKRKISINDMYELIDIFMRDVRAYNQIETISEMEIKKENVGDLFDCMQGILEDSIYVLEKDAALLDDKAWESDLKGLQEETEKVKVHMKEIRDRIQEKEKENTKARESEQEYQEKYEKLGEEVETISKKIDAIKGEIETFQKKIGSLEGEEEEYKKLLENLQSEYEKVEGVQAKYAAVLTAFNSSLMDQTALENIFDKNKAINVSDFMDESGLKKEIKSVGELKNWMECMQKQIGESLSVYQEELKQIILAVEEKKGESL